MIKKIKQKFVAAIDSELETNENFQELLESSSQSQLKEGTVVKGMVVNVTKDVAIIDVGLKAEGRISLSEFNLSSEDQIPKIGDMVDVYIEKIEGRNDRTIISREKAVREEAWAQLENAHKNTELVDGVIFGRVKGGFTVDLSGVVAFLPGSQVDVRPIKDITPLMSIVQPFQILKMDKKLGNIVVSRRAILEESRMEARNEMLSNIKEGSVLEGTVKNITDYGAFVDLGSIDGLLHVTDISWSRINHPSEVLKIGQQIKVMVIKYNEETKRISLGVKQMDSNPWQSIQDEYKVGDRLRGKITNVADYGAFIELKNGIEGLVHSSEISWTRANHNAKKLLSIGEEVDFVILEIDTEKHRISLSVKQAEQNPWTQFADKNTVGSILKAPVRHITEFGLFVELGENMDGMIHESDISWEGNGTELLKNYKKGDEVECKVLNIDTEKAKISLGIKQLSENSTPSTQVVHSHKKDDVITCTVKEVLKDGINVLVDEEMVCFVKKTELSADKSDQRSDKFAVGDRIDAQVASVSRNGTLNLSLKILELQERKKAIAEYGSVDSGASIGDILGNALGQNK